MSYGYHRLPRKTTPADYVTAVATQQNVAIAIAMSVEGLFQGNEVLGNTLKTPGDDQSMPQVSANMPVEPLDINGPGTIDVRAQGYSGDVCDQCQGSRMRWAGHCKVCEDCGTTTGCS
jgi:hypothetical protein